MKRVAVLQAGSRRSIAVEKTGDGRFLIDGRAREVSVAVVGDGLYSLIVDGRCYETSVRERKNDLVVELEGISIPLRLEDPFKTEDSSDKEGPSAQRVVSSPMAGRVVGLKVVAGQEVKEGEAVVVVEAMKMENELQSPKTGKVKSVLVKAGDAVEGGQDLMVIE